ncbi:MAG TPA: VWA domain-containing protein [Thermoanaerobaculia bacterium]
MPTRRTCNLLILPFALLLLGATQGRPDAIPAAGETIEVSIINVDVVVTDKAGNRVRGLTSDDFELLENGKKKAISNFAEYSSGVESGVVAEEGEAEAERRTIVVFVERFHLPLSQSKPLMAAIKQMLRDVVRPGDAVSVIAWDGEIDTLVEYTDDLEPVEAALDLVGTAAATVSFDLRGRLRDDVEAMRLYQLELAEMLRRYEIETVTLMPPERAGDATVSLQAHRALGEMKRKIAAVNAVIHTMAGGRGKKMLLLATNRLSEYAGAEYGFGGGEGRLTPEFKRDFDAKPLIRTMIDNANASGVTIYPLYPAGLAYTTLDAARDSVPDGVSDNLALMNETVMLRDVALRTGGAAAWHTSEVVKLMPRIRDDVTDYYSLAYRIETKREDRARNIDVKPKNSAYTVRARRQFVERSDESQMKDRVVAMLFHDVETPQFPITAQLGERQSGKRPEVLPLKVQIPIRHLTLLPQDGKHVGSFSVFVASRGDASTSAVVAKETQNFDIAESDLERAMSGHFTYNFDLQVDRNTDRLAIGVVDELSRTFSLLRLDVKREEIARK